MTNCLFDALFAPHANSSTVFITDPINNTTITYAEFIALTGKLANVLNAHGLATGDRLVAQVGKSPAALALYGACVRSGIVYLPLNTAYTASEVEYFVEDAGASIIVCATERQLELSPIAENNTSRVLTLSNDGMTGSLATEADVADSDYDTVARDADDLCALLYTSGTTGHSKGAMLTHSNLLSNAKALAQLWEFTEDDVLLHALPIFHTHGLFVASNVTLLSGAKMMFEPMFDIDRIVERLPHATCLMGVPTFYTRLLSDGRINSSMVIKMRLFISGSAPLLAETHRQFESTTGHKILERYGMTETNMNTSNPYRGDRVAGTVGLPLPGVEVRITQEDARGAIAQCGVGDIGSIEVRGPNVFSGYWNMPEKTAEEIRTDGFFITGDLGTIDDKGYISIVGRSKDLIITGGYNVYPKEIESVLDDQPGVVESAVIGISHEDFGETVVGVLVCTDPNLNLDSIRAAVSQSLARYKHPSELIIVDKLPRNTMGKVQKNILRDRYTR